MLASHSHPPSVPKGEAPGSNKDAPGTQRGRVVARLNRRVTGAHLGVSGHPTTRKPSRLTHEPKNGLCVDQVRIVKFSTSVAVKVQGAASVMLHSAHVHFLGAVSPFSTK